MDTLPSLANVKNGHNRSHPREMESADCPGSLFQDAQNWRWSLTARRGGWAGAPPRSLKGEMRAFLGPPGHHLSSPEMAQSGLRSTAGSMQDTRLNAGSLYSTGRTQWDKCRWSRIQTFLGGLEQALSLRGLFCSCSGWRLAVALATGSPGMARIEILRPVHRGAPHSPSSSPQELCSTSPGTALWGGVGIR